MLNARHLRRRNVHAGAKCASVLLAAHADLSVVAGQSSCLFPTGVLVTPNLTSTHYSSPDKMAQITYDADHVGQYTQPASWFAYHEMLQEPGRRLCRYAHHMWQNLLPLQETTHDGAIRRDKIASIRWTLREPRLWQRKYDGTSALL